MLTLYLGTVLQYALKTVMETTTSVSHHAQLQALLLQTLLSFASLPAPTIHTLRMAIVSRTARLALIKTIKLVRVLLVVQLDSGLIQLPSVASITVQIATTDKLRERMLVSVCTRTGAATRSLQT